MSRLRTAKMQYSSRPPPGAVTVSYTHLFLMQFLALFLQFLLESPVDFPCLLPDLSQILFDLSLIHI